MPTILDRSVASGDSGSRPDRNIAAEVKRAVLCAPVDMNVGVRRGRHVDDPAVGRSHVQITHGSPALWQFSRQVGEIAGHHDQSK